MSYWKFILALTVLNFLLIVGLCHAQDADASFSHSFELAATDIGIPVIGNKVIDSFFGGHNYWWTSQAFYGGACFMYRLGENDPHHWDEFLTLDLPSIGLSCLVEVLFPPSEKK